ncbi:MAG: hypothetical protein HRT38_05385 [Alteromonadaceae bacterium]|nr:hypothetical protein [Alteromonadaceae bacterium]
MISNKMNNDRKVILSFVWIFYIFNILYADVLTLMEGMSSQSSEDLTTEVVAMLLTPEMLLGAAILLETAMVMVVLSRILKYKANRRANITVGVLQTASVSVSLFVGEPAIYYMFFATVEILTSLFIVWYAWGWSNPEVDSVISNT